MIGGGKKRHAAKRGFKPVQDMIKSVGTDFNILTAESLFGFMLTMHVPVENAEYLGPSASGKKMTTPITEYLLKMSVITERRVRLDPIAWNGKPRVKSSETVMSFYREAKLQQKLWLDSIIGGKQPVCPDVYSITYDCGDMIFSSPSSSSSSVSSTVKRRHLNHPEVYDYLRTRHTEGFKLGAIAMEYIPNSRPLYSILHGPDVDDAYKNVACINAGAQVVRLFLDYGIIHVDLHAENIIVDESGMAYIIDFGRVLKLDEPELHESMLVRIKDLRRTYLEVLAKRPDRRDATSVQTLETLCRDIFNELKNIEMEIYHSFQMIGLHTFLEDTNLYYSVMIKYHELSSSVGIGLSRDAITTKIRSGEIELIEDHGLDAMIQQTIAFQAIRHAPPPPPPVHVTMVPTSTETPTAMFPFTSSATVAHAEHSVNNMGIGITKNRRRKNKQKKTRFKKKRR